VRIGPASSHQLTVPLQERLRPHRERDPGAARQHPCRSLV
jgi:hypothetical protein